MERSFSLPWRRAGLILPLVFLLLYLAPFMVTSPLLPLVPESLRYWLFTTTGSTCAGSCRCSYCDQIINGTCYIGGERGHRWCNSTCGANRCLFRPNEGGCGPIEYLGCIHTNCQNQAPTVQPVPTRRQTVVMPPPIAPTQTSTPVPPPTATPRPGVCAAPQTWVELQPPTIGSILHQPPYPVLQAQEFAAGVDHGVTFAVTASGGRAIQYVRRAVRACNGPGSHPADCPDAWHWTCRTTVQANHPDPVIRIHMEIELKTAARTWIADTLAPRYPGAHVRRSLHTVGEWHGNSMDPAASFQDWLPLDPGGYEGRVTAYTAGTPISAPQRVQDVHPVAVYLRDSTLVP